MPKEIMSARYFLVCVPFLYLVLGGWLSSLFDSGRFGRAVWTVAILTFIAGSVEPTLKLLKDGRGHYAEAVRFMADSSAEEAVCIGSDHDLRNGLLVTYYSQYPSHKKQIQYIHQNDLGVARPEWYIVHDNLADGPVGGIPSAMNLRGVGNYTLRRSYDFGGMSGWRWYIYQRT